MNRFFKILTILSLGLFLVFASVGTEPEAFWKMQTVGVVGNSSWGNWDETTEAGWGNLLTYIALFEGGAATNETGQGVVTGADLDLTQNNAIPAATGSPPTRALTAVSSQFFEHTSTLGAIADSGGWSIIIKAKDFADSATTQQLYYGEHVAGKLRIRFYKADTSNALNVNIYDVGASAFVLNATTSGAIPSTGDVYICVWYDGTYFRGGFSVTKPTKWSDFASTDRITATDTSASIGDAAAIGGDPVQQYSTVKLYYFILSGSVLIDNAS